MRMTFYASCVFALVLPPLLAGALQAQLPPEKAEKTFTVSAGLEMSLWASEPLFVNPTTMTIDHKGRFWVCEAVNYRRRLRGQPPLRKEGDRILVLEDTNLDGKADKVTTFYQAPDVESPLGIAVLPLPGGGQKVFVCQSPQIWTFEDADGDLKADGPPKTLLKGFQGIDHDHGVHGIHIGPDGRLWFTVGDAGVQGLKANSDGQASAGKLKSWTSNATDCRAGTVWTCKLDGTDLIRYAHNFRNNYMSCIDSFRSVFLSDNDDDGNQQTRICFVMPDGDYGYHPRGPGQSHWHEEQPGIVPKILRTGFGSPTGICVYEGDLLPPAYRGMLLHTDAGPRQVRCYHLKPQGAGYEVEQENVVNSSDPWFRPSDVQVAPDGSVFVADWYDPGVGGHGMGDTTRGRIYRLAPKGFKPAAVAYDVSSDQGITAALASPNLAQRAGAIEAIRTKGAGAAELLFTCLRQENSSPFLRARALGLLAELKPKLDEKGQALVEAQIDTALKSSDDRFGQLAVRIDSRIAALPEKGGSEAIALVKSASSQVLRELLLLWRRADPDKLKPLFNEVIARYQTDDTFLRKALNICAGSDMARRERVMADLDGALGSWSDRVAQLVFDLRPPGIRATLAKRIADPSITVSQRADLVDLLASAEEPDAGKVLLKLLATQQPVEVRQRAVEKLAPFLEGKWAALTKDPEFSTLLSAIADKAAWAKLAGAAKLASGLADLGQLAQGDAGGETVRAATEAIGRIDTPEALELLKKLVTASATRADALNALGNLTRTRGAKTGKGALEVLKSALAGPEPGKVVAVLAQSSPGSEWLLAQKDKLPADLAAEAGRYLRNSPFQIVRNKAMLAFPPPGRLNMAKLPNAAELAKRTGRAEAGRKLFEASAKNELQCQKCHRLQGLGGDIGPDLSLIGKKASRENLFDSLLTPSKAIADQYIVNVVATNKGQTISGLLVEETPNHLLIRDGNGKDYKILLSEIDERTKSKVSIMPADLVAWMTEDDLVDLVEYLLTLKTGSLTPAKWKILGPMADVGETALSEQTSLEKGRPNLQANIVPELKTKNGKTPEWQTIRPAADGYLDLAAFHGDKKDHSWSYLLTEVKSETAQDAAILLGADDGSRLIVNGKAVHEQNGRVSASPAMFRIPVKLQPGANSILLKITNGDGPHGAYLTILSEGQLTD